MKRPEFTRNQEYWICEKIDDWYLFWKDRIVDDNTHHHLGVSKEDLKMLLCDDDADNN